MTRKKVQLAFIVNNSSRKATYKKRKRGLLKKVHEISTLCGIRAGAIIYGPYDPTPEVYPSVEGMNELIDAFRNLPEIDRQKNMVNQEEFIRQRITKVDNLLTKQKRDNREVHITETMYHLLQMGYFPNQEEEQNRIPPRDLNDIGYLVDQYLNGLNRRIDVLEGRSGMEIGESSNAGAARDPSEAVGALTHVEGATAPATTVHGVGSSSSSAAAAGASLFNQMYPFPQPYAPYSLGFYEQARNQNQPMEMMMNRPPQHMGYAANQMGFPFMDNTPQQPLWFPGESSSAPQQPQQFFPGESSAAPPPPATSGSDTPATAPNPTYQ
ncbi:hypothetical protein Bca4012_085830 [Brassica carinata]